MKFQQRLSCYCYTENRIDANFVITSGTGGCHYYGVIMGAMASQTNSLTVVYSTVHSGANRRKHQSFASLAFVRGIHRWPVNSPHKWPVTRRMFPFDDVIMLRQPPVMASLAPWQLSVFISMSHARLTARVWPDDDISEYVHISVWGDHLVYAICSTSHVSHALLLRKLYTTIL